jgi:hypothetical protein
MAASPSVKTPANIGVVHYVTSIAGCTSWQLRTKVRSRWRLTTCFRDKSPPVDRKRLPLSPDDGEHGDSFGHSQRFGADRRYIPADTKVTYRYFEGLRTEFGSILP